MMMLLRFLAQLSVELKQLPVYFYLITVLIQFDCFDKSVCS